MIQPTLVIGHEDFAAINDIYGWDKVMDLMIDRLAKAFANAGTDTSNTPNRDGFRRCDAASGALEWMPHHELGRAVTIKTVAYTPDNPGSLGLPTVIGTVARFDDITGHLVAISDGVLLTAIRTGAASAVASRLLAIPGSRVLGLIGAGAQAVTQLHALSRAFPLERVLVHDIDPHHAASFVHRAAFTGLPVELVDVSKIEAAADIICTATTVPVGGGPVLAGTSLRPHVHINAVGADLPGKVELPSHVLKKALVCPDHIGQARLEGECQQLSGHEIGPDLPAICADPELADQHRWRTTVYDSTGFALEDHVALDLILSLALEAGLGHRIELECISRDALDPYEAVRSIGTGQVTGTRASR